MNKEQRYARSIRDMCMAASNKVDKVLSDAGKLEWHKVKGQICQQFDGDGRISEWRVSQNLPQGAKAALLYSSTNGEFDNYFVVTPDGTSTRRRFKFVDGKGRQYVIYTVYRMSR